MASRLQTLVGYLKKHPEILWLLAIVAVSTILRLAFLYEPFERDEGQYATIGQVILRGGLPYRDAVEIKPPGVFYLYALAIGLFGATTEAVRIFTALYATVTVAMVFLVTRLFADARAGLLAALVFGVFSTYPLIQGSSSNTEVFLILPLTAGLWFLVKANQSGNRLYLYGVGFCAAAALMIKPVVVPIVALECVCVLVMAAAPRRWKTIVLDLTAVLLPMVVCAALVLSYFYLRGGLEDLLYWTVEFPRRYKDARVSGPPLLKILHFLKDSLLLPGLLGILSSLWFAASKRGFVNKIPLLMILAVSVAILLPGKNFAHYFIMIIPFLAIPAGIGLAHLLSDRGVVKYLLLLVVLGLFGSSVSKTYKYYTEYSPELVSTLKYGTTFVNVVGVAQYIRERTRPDNYIFQWGLEPEIYFLADRPCPNASLVSLVPEWSKDPRAAVGQLIMNLYEKKPVYIVIQQEWAESTGYAEIKRLVQMRYHLEVVLGSSTDRFYLFRLNGG